MYEVEAGERRRLKVEGLSSDDDIPPFPPLSPSYPLLAQYDSLILRF